METLCADCFDRDAVSNAAHTDTRDTPTGCARCWSVEAYAVCLTEYLKPRTYHYPSCENRTTCNCAESDETISLCSFCARVLTDDLSICEGHEDGHCEACGVFPSSLTVFLYRTLDPRWER